MRFPVLIAAVALAASVHAASLAAESPAVAPGVETSLRSAETLSLAGDYAGAAKALAQAHASAPGDVRITTALAAAEIMSGKSGDALELLKAVPAPNAGSADVLLWSAVAEADDASASAALLARGLAAAGDDETALYDMAERFLRAGAPSVSAALYERILAVYPSDSMFDLYSRLHLATYYHLAGRDGDAAAVLEPARKAFEYSDIDVISTSELDYMVAYYKGLASARAGDLYPGVNTLRDAQAAFDSGIAAQGAVVKLLDAAGRTDEGDAAYGIFAKRLRDAVAAAPEKASAYHDLAAFAEASGRGAQEGLSAADWSLKLEPLSGDCMDTKAALLLAAGRAAEALAFENRAIAMASAPRWGDAGKLDYLVRRRIDILKRLGKPLPDALIAFPAPRPKPQPKPEPEAPPAESTSAQ